MSDLAFEIDPARLLADLRHLATFGKQGTGVTRLAFSRPDVEARRWLRERMEEAGLAAAIDDVGNVIGEAPADGPAILIGSHSDSVPGGGWLDGAMGVIYGIEIARAVIEAGLAERCPVDAVAFQDEESTYLPTLGSRTLFGAVGEDEISVARNIDGHRLADAIAASGFAGNPPRRLDPGRYRAFLEAHIEQGPRLEAMETRIGVVTAIVGIRRFRVHIDGQAGHAGTVPMAMRKDAGAVAIGLSGALLEGFAALAGPDTVWNIGSLTLTPGAANVIPEAAEIVVEIRDTDPAILDSLEDRLRALARDHADRSGQEIAAHPHARHPAGGDGPGPRRRDRGGGPGARRAACADAERRRARRDGALPLHAVGDALRPLDRRAQPHRHRGHVRGGHRARLPRAGRRRGADRGRLMFHVKQRSTLLTYPLSEEPALSDKIFACAKHRCARRPVSRPPGTQTAGPARPARESGEPAR